MAFRVTAEGAGNSVLLRFFTGRWSEFFYVVLGLRGLELKIEFPSDWHEQRAGWLHVGLGLITFAIAFPWPWVVPDHYQCSGPQFGFRFFGDGLHLHWGKCKGTRHDPMTIIDMPWHWRHREHKVLSAPETHPYCYVLANGVVQLRQATIKAESRLWTRPWLPHRRLEHTIDIDFSDEVGERTGSWKGGVLGCGYQMLEGETPLMTLRRMELDRKF